MPEPSVYDAIDVTLQLAAAFGQGAGIMLMEADALRPAYDEYRRHIERSLPYWAEDALTGVCIMRAMGAYAAHLALSESRLVISRADVQRALEVVTHPHAAPLFVCRITAR